MNRKKIALSVSTIALACALPVPALAEETAAPAAPVAVTAGLGINGENKTDTEKSSNLDSDAASSESTKQSEKAEETAQKGAEESVKTSVAASAGKSKQGVSAPQAVQAKAADATSSLPDITFGIGTYRDAGDDYMLDKVLYSYAVNASTPGVTVDGKYYVVPLQPIKDWLAANAPEYRLAGAIAGNSSVRVYASKNGKAIYEVEKDPNYKPADPKPAHTLIAKLGFRKADAPRSTASTSTPTMPASPATARSTGSPPRRCTSGSPSTPSTRRTRSSRPPTPRASACPSTAPSPTATSTR